jgi:hypothetical protein
MFLCGAATVNIVAWSLTANSVARRQHGIPVDALAQYKIQLALSGLYVLGCAFRSVLPVYDIPRLGLFDTFFSSVMVGRSVATVAELAFAAQWAVMLHTTAESTYSATARIVSKLIMPLILTAEICSWTAVLTTSTSGMSLRTPCGARRVLSVSWLSRRSFRSVPLRAAARWLHGVSQARCTSRSCLVSTSLPTRPVGRRTRPPENTI